MPTSLFSSEFDSILSQVKDTGGPAQDVPVAYRLAR